MYIYGRRTYQNQICPKIGRNGYHGYFLKEFFLAQKTKLVVIKILFISHLFTNNIIAKNLRQNVRIHCDAANITFKYNITFHPGMQRRPGTIFVAREDVFVDFKIVESSEQKIGTKYFHIIIPYFLLQAAAAGACFAACWEEGHVVQRAFLHTFRHYIIINITLCDFQH